MKIFLFRYKDWFCVSICKNKKIDKKIYFMYCKYFKNCKKFYFLKFRNILKYLIILKFFLGYYVKQLFDFCF